MTEKRFIAGILTVVLTFSALVFGCLKDNSPMMPKQISGSSAPRSKEWPRVRAEHLRRYPVCEACGGNEGLQVHHCLPFHTNPSRELDPENLITLCTSDTHNDHLWIGHAGNFKTFNPNVREDAKRFRQMIANRVPNE